MPRTSILVFREAHWPVPRKLAGVLPFKWGMLHRLTAALIPPGMKPSRGIRWLHGMGRPIVWLFWRLVELLLRFQFKLDTKISRGRNLLPSRPVEIGCFGESTMVPRPGFTDLIRSGRVVAHRTEIDRYLESGIALADGDKLDVDLVVFGTGWTNGYEFLPSEQRTALGHDEDGFYLYRHMLHPDVPDLVFLGRASTFLSIVTYNVQARWLAELLAGRIELPDREAMLQEIDQTKRWKRSWMPFGAARSARVLLHMTNYHDELLRDFGARPYRKRGALAPLKELLSPYQSSDYRDIAAGTFRRRDRGTRAGEVSSSSAVSAR